MTDAGSGYRLPQAPLVRDGRRSGLPALWRIGRLSESAPRNGSMRYRCKACTKDFTVTSGTLFASHKMPLRAYLAANRDLLQ